MQNTEYLNQIYQTAKSLNLVKNQFDFSVLCGRTPAWFSCIKTRKLPFTAEAAMTLAINIREQASTQGDVTQQQKILDLSDKIICDARNRISKKCEIYKNETY
jgi:hypothetical protein